MNESVCEIPRHIYIENNIYFYNNECFIRFSWCFFFHSRTIFCFGQEMPMYGTVFNSKRSENVLPKMEIPINNVWLCVERFGWLYWFFVHEIVYDSCKYQNIPSNLMLAHQRLLLSSIYVCVVEASNRISGLIR